MECSLHSFLMYACTAYFHCCLISPELQWLVMLTVFVFPLTHQMTSSTTLMPSMYLLQPSVYLSPQIWVGYPLPSIQPYCQSSILPVQAIPLPQHASEHSPCYAWSMESSRGPGEGIMWHQLVCEWATDLSGKLLGEWASPVTLPAISVTLQMLTPWNITICTVPLCVMYYRRSSPSSMSVAICWNPRTSTNSSFASLDLTATNDVMYLYIGYINCFS